MKRCRLDNFKRGWIVGNFEPSLAKENFEVAIKRYEAGDKEAAHYHLESDEVTVIVRGAARFKFKNGEEVICRPDDILIIERGEVASFEALTRLSTVVIRFKSVAGDKYLVETTN